VAVLILHEVVELEGFLVGWESGEGRREVSRRLTRAIKF